MKYFKYIALLLLVAVTMGSCDKKDVSYMAEPVDESAKAYIQIGYYEPVTAGAANYMYYIDINGVEYGNDGATFLATFNTVPSGGTNRYYAVDAGNVNIKLHRRVELPTPARCSMVSRTWIPRSMSLWASLLASARAPIGSRLRSARPFTTALVHSVVRFASLPWTILVR